jgi:hypothetical protein
MGWYNNSDYWIDDRSGMLHFQSSRKVGKPMGPEAPHYPNSAERVLLTQMMQKSGKTEAEVRADKSNRQKLAEAAKSMHMGKGREHRYQILLKRAKRSIAAALGVPAYDPDVEAYLDTPDMFVGSMGIMTRRRMLMLRARGL